jgi:hypothetical protein
MGDWQIVETVGTEEEASLIAGYLEAEGIPATVESLLFHQEPVNFGTLGEVRVMVRKEDLERAQALLDEREESPAEVPDEPEGEPPAG